MVKKKKTLKDWKISIVIGPNTDLILDVNGFIRDVDSSILATMDQAKMKIAPKHDGHQYSLSQCAEVCGAVGPTLNYYVKEGIVSPYGRPKVGTKKYFTYDALLTFWIIVKLKVEMRINAEVVRGLQRKVQNAVSKVEWQ